MAIGKFRLEVTYSGYSDTLDEKIEKLIKKRCWASGGGLGTRDMSFDFRTVNARYKAKQRLTSARLPITVEMYDAKDDDEGKPLIEVL